MTGTTSVEDQEAQVAIGAELIVKAIATKAVPVVVKYLFKNGFIQILRFLQSPISSIKRQNIQEIALFMFHTVL